MNIEQARAIAIAEILEKLEFKPNKENGTDATYYSPFRNENTPSFHVNTKDNVWFDHGEGIGGNAFDLVVQIPKFGGYSYLPADALRWLRNTDLDPSVVRPRDLVTEKKSKWKLIDVKELDNIALIRYLECRGIDVELVKPFILEIERRRL